MLDEQDLVKIENVVDRKTSDLRQKVSNIEHEIKEMRTESNTKYEDLKNLFKTTTEMIITERIETKIFDFI